MTKDDVLNLAVEVIWRGNRRKELQAALDASDMAGLECSETVELERLAAQDADAALVLAVYVLKEA